MDNIQLTVSDGQLTEKVEFFIQVQDIVNLAHLYNRVSQGSTYNNDPSLTASAAVDENTATFPAYKLQCG